MKEVIKRISRLTSSELSFVLSASLLSAVMLTGATVFSFQKSRIFVAHAKPTQAEVIEAIDPKSPTFQYKVDGAVFESRNMKALGEHQADATYVVGDTATIFYNPENPTEIRDVLSADRSRFTEFLTVIAAFAWLMSAGSAFLFLRARNRIATLPNHVETRCVFVALEGTNTRMVRLVCRWIHPETGAEWLLRSDSLHPSALPKGLELGMSLACTVDFDDPRRHEVQTRSALAA